MKVIVRSFTKEGNVIHEYPCDSEKDIEIVEGYILNEMEYYIMKALDDTGENKELVQIEDSNKYIYGI